MEKSVQKFSPRMCYTGEIFLYWTILCSNYILPSFINQISRSNSNIIYVYVHLDVHNFNNEITWISSFLIILE